MRNPSGSLGRGEFIRVILYVPGRTYILLSSREAVSQLIRVMNIQGLG